jgi:hypothetical protein
MRRAYKVTTGDASEIAPFSNFFLDYSLAFFTTKKSTLQSVGDGSGEKRLLREKLFEPITTNVGRKLPFLEPFEVCVLTL